MASMNVLTRINGRYGSVLTSSELADYLDAINDGTLTVADVEQVAQQRQRTRQRTRETYRMVANNLGVPAGVIDLFVDNWIEFQDPDLALMALREDPSYDRYFPGNRLPDGRVRFDERNYLAYTESYAEALEDYGLNPDAYRDKFVDLIEGEVAPDEFAGRVQALYDNVIRAPEEVRQSVAAEFGIDGTVEELLGVMVDPDIANQVRERRLSIGVVTGQAARFGFNRSRARVQQLVDMGLTGQGADQFYSEAARALPRLSTSASITGERFGIGEFEDASVMSDTDAFNAARRLSAQESSRFSRSGSVLSDRRGALRGLDRR